MTTQNPPCACSAAGSVGVTAAQNKKDLDQLLDLFKRILKCHFPRVKFSRYLKKTYNSLRAFQDDIDRHPIEIKTRLNFMLHLAQKTVTLSKKTDAMAEAKVETTDECLEFLLLGYKDIDTHISSYNPNAKELLVKNGKHFQNAFASVGQQNKLKPVVSYRVILFGKTLTGKSVALTVTTWGTLMIMVHPSYTTLMLTTDLQHFFQRDTEGVQRRDVKGYVRRYTPATGFFPDPNSRLPLRGKRPYLEIFCRTRRALSAISNFFKWRKKPSQTYTIIEKNIPITLRLLQELKVAPCSVLRVSMKDVVLSRRAKYTHSDIEATCYVRPWGAGNRCPIQRSTMLPNRFPIKLLSFDIECYSPSGGFPDHPEKDDQIISICTTTECMRSGERYSSVHALYAYEHLNSQDLLLQEYHNTEAELLESFRDYFTGLHPIFAKTGITHHVDFSTHYNGHAFDWQFLLKRMLAVCSSDSRAFFLDRVSLNPTTLQEGRFSSSAFGASETLRPSLSYPNDVDLLTWVRRNKKFKSNTLNNVAKILLNNRKVDLPIKEMIACFLSKDPRKRSRVHEYCMQDTILPLDIWKSQYILEALIELCRVTHVFPYEQFTRGASFRVYSQLFIFCRSKGFVLNPPADYSHLQGFKGATVLEMQKGLHLDVVVLDFAKLYPSIIESKNLCFSTWVSNDKYLNLPGYEYFDFTTDQGHFYFVQNVPGILPEMVKALGDMRAAAKTLMRKAKADGNKAMEVIYDSRQKAIKVCSNSIYGFCGAIKAGIYPCFPVAATTTAWGRQLITRTKDSIESWYAREGAHCVYGDTDSVMFKFTKVPNTEAGYRHVHRIGDEAAKRVSEMFGKPIVLENEKTFRRVLMLTKKRYVAMSQETPTDVPKRDVKGVMEVRRDFSDFQQSIYSRVIDYVLTHTDAVGAMRILENAFEELISGKIPVPSLALTRSLRAEYKNENVPQKWVQRKMQLRNPGSAPKPGDRVSFVPIVMKRGHEATPLYKRVEDTEFVVTNNLAVDTSYYIRSFLKNMTDVFSAFGQEDQFSAMVETYTMRATQKMKGNRDITQYFKSSNQKATSEWKNKTSKESERRRAKKRRQQIKKDSEIHAKHAKTFFSQFK